MATACPLQLDVSHLKHEVRRTYPTAACNPHGDFHFHRGPEYAARMLGYDPAELEALPKTATSAFAGVGNPFDMESLPAGARVVDIGSGAGMDCLLAGKRVERGGTVVATPQRFFDSFAGTSKERVARK